METQHKKKTGDFSLIHFELRLKRIYRIIGYSVEMKQTNIRLLPLNKPHFVIFIKEMRNFVNPDLELDNDYGKFIIADFYLFTLHFIFVTRRFSLASFDRYPLMYLKLTHQNQNERIFEHSFVYKRFVHHISKIRFSPT